MLAVLKGVGDAFMLGCNRLLWPSLGLIDDQEASDDISRKWQGFAYTGRKIYCVPDKWKLWMNDPDCILLTGNQSENKFMYYASVIFATGGMKLSGDDMITICPTFTSTKKGRYAYTCSAIDKVYE